MQKIVVSCTYYYRRGAEAVVKNIHRTLVMYAFSPNVLRATTSNSYSVSASRRPSGTEKEVVSFNISDKMSSMKLTVPENQKISEIKREKIRIKDKKDMVCVFIKNQFILKPPPKKCFQPITFKATILS